MLRCVAKIQAVLDPLCLASVSINPESRVKVSLGPAAAELVQHGWRVFLVKVHNEAGVTPPLRLTSPQAAALAEEDQAAALSRSLRSRRSKPRIAGWMQTCTTRNH